MKNNVDLELVLNAALENTGNLGADSEAVLVPCTCSDYYLASKLSEKFGNKVSSSLDEDIWADDQKKISCVSWAYECDESLHEEMPNNTTLLIGVLLTSKSLEEAKALFPNHIVLFVIDPKDNFLFRDMAPEDLVRQIIDYVGEDPNRPGVVGTPERVVRMWREIYGGYNLSNKPKITTFVEEEAINSRDIIFDKGEAWSNCEHHMAPFKIEYCFAYIPNPKGKLLGLSKISRVVRYCSQKLQLQERIGTDVVNMIVEELTSGVGEQNPPLGVAIMIKGAHSCKTMRGVKTPGSMISTYTWGCFEEHNAQRREFIETAETMLGSGSVMFC